MHVQASVGVDTPTPMSRRKTRVLGGLCKNGHVLTTRTMLLRPSGRYRMCRTCHNDEERARYRCRVLGKDYGKKT